MSLTKCTYDNFISGICHKLKGLSQRTIGTVLKVLKKELATETEHELPSVRSLNHNSGALLGMFHLRSFLSAVGEVDDGSIVDWSRNALREFEYIIFIPGTCLTRNYARLTISDYARARLSLGVFRTQVTCSE